MPDKSPPQKISGSGLLKGLLTLVALAAAAGGIYWFANAGQREAIAQLNGMGVALELDDYGNVKAMRINPGNSLKALDHVAALPKLKTLTLPVTDATNDDLAPLMKASSIEELILSGNPGIDDAGLKHLVNLANLKTLYLTEVPIYGPGLQDLAVLKNLDVLSLSYTKVEDDDLALLANFPSLRVLDLSYTACTNDGLQHLAGLSRLQELWLVAAKATPEGAAKLKESLPKTNVRFGL